VIANASSSFERNDRETLNRHFDVVNIEKPSGKRDWLRFLNELRQIKDTKAVFVWFAGWPAYFALKYAKRSNVPIAVVTGGYDVARIPEIGYGATLHLKERMATMRVLRQADVCLPVSMANRFELFSRCTPKRSNFIYNGVDHNHFVPKVNGERNGKIISVGGVNRKNYQKKGIDRFIEAARALSDLQFIMIGGYRQDYMAGLARSIPKNLIFTGYLDDPELLQQYQEASVYLQPSIHESFGVSVVEAMLCGCVPVVSDRWALPEVVEGVGRVFPYGDLYAMIEAIKSALDATDNEREHIRERGEYFSLEKREQQLIKVIKEMIE